MRIRIGYLVCRNLKNWQSKKTKIFLWGNWKVQRRSTKEMMTDDDILEMLPRRHADLPIKDITKRMDNLIIRRKVRIVLDDFDEPWYFRNEEKEKKWTVMDASEWNSLWLRLASYDSMTWYMTLIPGPKRNDSISSNNSWRRTTDNRYIFNNRISQTCHKSQME